MRLPKSSLTMVAGLALAGCAFDLGGHPSPGPYPPAFELASRGDVVGVTAALDGDRRLIRAREADHATLLHDAAQEGQLAMATLLIDRGSRLEARTGGGLTPLHLAAQTGDLPMIQLLVSRGAKVNARDNQGRTPAAHADLHEHAAAAAWLRSRGGR